ncbi:hypothetical protein PMSD_18890 [Paenibacillus macquariensis subsp. defensor]|nr:hypothetical protein PMSD_18890 [Paenibacillus macquariensis subsp. defensor]
MFFHGVRLSKNGSVSFASKRLKTNIVVSNIGQEKANYSMNSLPSEQRLGDNNNILLNTAY